MKELIVVLTILVVGYGALALYFRHECRKAKNISRKIWEGAKMMDECKWMQDEICVNADCPMCCDYCPVADYEGVCRYEERGEDDG